MIRTTRMVNECKCKNCGIVQLLGQTFNGRRCCSNPHIDLIGMREIVEYEKTIEEEKAEVIEQMNHPSGML